MTKFNDQYHADNERIVASDALIQQTIIKMKGVMQKKQVQPNYLSKGAMAVAGVGALALLAVIGGQLIKPTDKIASDTSPSPVGQNETSDNWFNFTVSAAELSPQLALVQGKSEQSSMITVSQSGDDNLQLYNALDFQYEGANIAQVELSVDQGYFGYFSFQEAANPSESISEFVKYGQTYTVSQDQPAHSEQLYWGIDYQDAEIVFPELPEGIHEMTPEEQSKLSVDPIMINGQPEPDSITITATVTFTDGQKQEQSLVYQLGNGSLKLSE